MVDFRFIENKTSKKWTILDSRRAGRPDSAKGTEPVCPFCPGHEKEEPEVYRIGEKEGDGNWPASNASRSDAGWLVRVIPNKFPFAPIHEIVIHSPDHHKNFGELSEEQTQLIFRTFKDRYLEHQNTGQVYIFHNKGEAAGESLPHPHSQIAVIPENVRLEIPILEKEGNEERLETSHFYIFAPETSQWPDEIWLAPKQNGKNFGEVTDDEILDLSRTLSKLIQILKLKLGNEFPYNFYIYPKENWYLRFIPRVRILGGFEIGTNVFVNTQDPKETIAFLRKNFQ